MALPKKKYYFPFSYYIYWVFILRITNFYSYLNNYRIIRTCWHEIFKCNLMWFTLTYLFNGFCHNWLFWNKFWHNITSIRWFSLTFNRYINYIKKKYILIIRRYQILILKSIISSTPIHIHLKKQHINFKVSTFS